MFCQFIFWEHLRYGGTVLQSACSPGRLLILIAKSIWIPPVPLWNPCMWMTFSLMIGSQNWFASERYLVIFLVSCCFFKCWNYVICAEWCVGVEDPKSYCNHYNHSLYGCGSLPRATGMKLRNEKCLFEVCIAYMFTGARWWHDDEWNAMPYIYWNFVGHHLVPTNY